MSDLELTQIFDKTMRAYNYAVAGERTSTNLSKVLWTIWRIKIGKTAGPTGIQNRVLRHLPKRAITILTKVFNEFLRRQYLTPVWQHTHMASIPNKKRILRSLLPTDP
jgi:hypothetical protein